MHKLKPVKKGYKINLRNVESMDEYIKHHLDDEVVAVDEKEARRKALSQLIDQGIENDDSGEPLTYITVRVYRYPEIDLFDVPGIGLRNARRLAYDRRLAERNEEFEKMLADNPGAYAFILKGGLYYRPNCCGYVEEQAFAGVYTLEYAVKQCLSVDLSAYMRPVIINIPKHNEMINRLADDLKSRLIPL